MLLARREYTNLRGGDVAAGRLFLWWRSALVEGGGVVFGRDSWDGEALKELLF